MWPRQSGIWNEERTELLRKLWLDPHKNYSATEIAAMAPFFNVGATRSAILGKLHREGLLEKRKPKEVKENPRERQVRVRNQTRAVRPRQPVVPPPRLPVAVLVPTCAPATLHERRGCCYPVTDGFAPFLFCNALPLMRRGYCGYHAVVMYRKPGEER